MIRCATILSFRCPPSGDKEKTCYINIIVNKRRPRVLITYALLQLPGLALVVLALLALQPLFDLSSRQVTAIIAIWVLKDAVLFPFVWRAFDWHRSDDAQVMVGTEALVVERLDPEGYVHVHGELWKAATMREGQPVEKGTIVYIRGMRGLTLIVE